MNKPSVKLAQAAAIRATKADLNWAAGLFEGEGTITIAVRRMDETYRIVVTLGNTDRSVIDWFQQRWPGYVQPAYGKRLGRRPAWYWTLIGPRSESFLRIIRPFLRTERVQRKADPKRDAFGKVIDAIAALDRKDQGDVLRAAAQLVGLKVPIGE